MHIRELELTATAHRTWFQARRKKLLARLDRLRLGVGGPGSGHSRAFAPVQLAVPGQPFPALTELGRSFPEYRRIFVGAEAFVDAHQEAIARIPTEGGILRAQIAGFLRPADALALYELAYCSIGNVLELGSAWGLSTTILCLAASQRALGIQVVSIEHDPEMQRATTLAVASLGLTRSYRGLAGDADAITVRLVALHHRFGVVFVDHDHRFEATRTICTRLGDLLLPGGVAVFHDFNDVRNRTEPSAYGVYPAVRELFEDQRFSFLGVIGCCGLVLRLQ